MRVKLVVNEPRLPVERMEVLNIPTAVSDVSELAVALTGVRTAVKSCTFALIFTAPMAVALMLPLRLPLVVVSEVTTL